MDLFPDEFKFLIYRAENEQTAQVVIMDDTVWLTQKAMAELFDVESHTINYHLREIYSTQELQEDSTARKIRVVQQEGTRQVKRDILHYNLDAIISVGYRVNSIRATHFRMWATGVLKEYMIKGFALDDERLKGNGGGNYWKELLDRIRDIRSSEKMLYRQVLDLYATSLDYDPHSDESVRFFQIVQNKLHYAAHGHTAAEVIWQRADAEKPFMGLKTFSGELPVKKDIGVAKNYLDEQELRVLNNLVSGYFDLAEIAAIEHRPMYMKDYVDQLDSVLSSGGRKLLTDSGNVSHEQALEKANAEYRKYQRQTISPVEEAYLETIHSAEKAAKMGERKNRQR